MAGNKQVQTTIVEQSKPFPLERLPAETRLHVFSYVLSVDIVFIDDGSWEGQATPDFKPRGYFYLEDSPNMAALLKVNRATYQDTVALLYSLNTFRFEKYTDLRCWLHMIGGSRQYVTSILISLCGDVEDRTEHASDACELLDQCTRLKQLLLRFYFHGDEATRTEEVKVLFKNLEGFLLNRHISREESMRRLAMIDFVNVCHPARHVHAALRKMLHDLLLKVLENTVPTAGDVVTASLE